MSNKEPSIIWACRSCGSKNRVRLERLEEEPKCGSCSELLALDAPQAVDSKGFDQVVLQSSLPILVDFWAPWCGPCRMIAPALEQIAKKLEGRLLITKVNTDEEPSLGAKYRIQGIPALLLFKDGKLLDQLAGALPAAQLERWLLERI